jgi:transcriptional regulator with XRE-family HTH domain
MMVPRAASEARADTPAPRVEDAPHLVLVPPTATPATFCAELKAAREASGMSLAAIAAKSKVSVAFYAALERGDLSRWPKGIYRRSFFRAYAEAVGLNGDATIDEFVQLFPDEPASAVQEKRTATAGPTAPLRLTFDEVSEPRNLWAQLKRWIGTQLIRWGAALSA